MNNKKKIKILNQLLDDGKQLIGLPRNNQRYPQWLAQTRKTLEMLFNNNSREAINFNKHVRSWNAFTPPTEQEKQERYDEELAINLDYVQELISGLDQEIKIQRTFRLEPIYKNSRQGLHRFWQDTVKAGVEGLVNGLKKH